MIMRGRPVFREIKRARSCSTGFAAGEEVLQYGATLGLQDAATDVDAMVEARVANDVKQGADRTSLRVEGTKDEPRNPSQYESAGAHGAGLKGDDQREARQPPRSQPPRRLPQRQNLGMRRRIMSNFPLVARGR